jgi:hypothetical protein
MGRQAIAAVVLCCALSAEAAVCLGGGTGGATPFNFLFTDTAGGGAMGGAGAAAAGGAGSLLYNPAGLAKVGRNQAGFGYASHFQDVNREYLGLALKGGYGLLVNTVNSGGIRRTTLSNPAGTGLGDFGINDLLVSAGYGKLYKDGLLGFGIAGKYISESIDSYSARSVAADLGALVYMQKYGLPLTLGAAAQNIGTKARFQSAREELPVNIKAGLSWEFPGAGLLAADLNLPRYGKTTVHIGGQYEAVKGLVLRLGYNGRNDAGSGLTLGLAGTWSDFTLEYAFVPYGYLGDSQVIGVSYGFD